MSTVIKDFIEGFSNKKRSRILSFGSSNTERYLPGLHWFDCFELALKQKYGRIHTCINTGLSGDTSRGLLERFEDDAAFFNHNWHLLLSAVMTVIPTKILILLNLEQI